MSEEASGQIDNVMHEDRMFPPSSDFSSKAKIGSLEEYQAIYDRAKDDPESFWDEIGKSELHWFKPYDTVLKGAGTDVEWFVNGQTNMSFNCLDANIEAGRGDRAAIIWKANREIRER